MMNFIDKSCVDFVDVLASREPVPGGGGASALVGAIGTALGNMTGSLTLGKKKYADVQDDILALKTKADMLQTQLLELVERDALVFAPLAKAYGMPRDTDEQKAEKARVMENALREACSVPLEIMRKCCEAIDLQKQFADKGAAIAISDVGVGVALSKAALMGASLNVFINTKAMTDQSYSGSINKEANAMLERYTVLADEIYKDVLQRLI